VIKYQQRLPCGQEHMDIDMDGLARENEGARNEDEQTDEMQID
jgi:hypothetical protein